jgi:DNA-binding response OmpR family regulator
MRIIKASSSKAGPSGSSGVGVEIHRGRGARQLQARSARRVQHARSGETQPPAGSAGQLRVGHLDRDSGLQLVTAKRLERLGAEHSVLPLGASPEQIAAMRLNALVVDLAILGSRCWDWLELICELRQNLGVVVCTGPSTVAERVRALRMGADDWLTKPCHPEELIARVEVVVCSRQPAEPHHLMQPVVAGELEIRRHEHQAFVDGSSLRLTAREFQLLELLASYDGCILEREFIYERIWGYDMNRGDRSVDVFVRKVRQKLEITSPSWGYIHTHFGVGYRFAALSATGTEPAEDTENQQLLMAA